LFFIVWVLFKELFKKVEREHFDLRGFLKDYIPAILIAIVFVFLLYIYMYNGNLYLLGYTGSGPGKSIFTNIHRSLLFDINLKFKMIIYLFASVAFISLLDLSTVSLILSYIAYVFYTTGSSNLAIFGLMYPIMSAGPI